jgi:hypothetical protein
MVSHWDGACPSRAGLQLFHMELEPGAQQGLKGSGLRERGRYPRELWDWLLAGVWHRLVVGSWWSWPRGGYSGMVWPVQLRDGDSAMCGSGTELGPGTAGGAESLAERSSSSADLRGRDLAGRLFLY